MAARQELVAANFTQVLEVEATKVEPGGADSDEESAIKVQAEVVDAEAAPRSEDHSEHEAMMAQVQGTQAG